MSKVIACDLPKGSMLSPDMEDYDFFDAFKVVVEGQNYTPKDIVTAFMLSPPKWVGFLFVLRNTLAGWVGLKAPDASMVSKEFFESLSLKVGEDFGHFHLYKKSDDEAVLGLDDSHLDFRVSMHQKPKAKADQTELTISTGVVYNNWVGRVYFLPVRYFHVWVVKSMMKRMVGILEMRG